MARISVTKFEKALDKNNTTTIPLNGVEDTFIEIKKTISLQSMVEFVEVAALSCIDTETGEYIPQVLDFAIKREVLTRYANFTMPQKAEKQYELIYGTDVVPAVVNNINQVQFQEIVTSIHRKVQFLLDSITSAATVGVNQLVARLDNMAEENKAIFDAVNGEDVAKMIENFDKVANMNEAQIVEALKKAEAEDTAN